MSAQIKPAVEPELRSAFVASVDRVEVRRAQDGSGDYTLTGHAAVFNRWSEDLSTWAGTFREKIAPGAFRDVLKSKPDVRLLYNHDGLTLARTKSGTLELSEDEDGLRVWAQVAPTGFANDLRLAMQRGDVDQMSFAFAIGEDEWHEDHETEEVERTILRVSELFDVSVVSFPAYPDTDAVMRELRSAVDRGRISIPPNRPAQKADDGYRNAAPAETDPAGTKAAPDSAQAETDPAVVEERDDSAQAETDPAVVGVAALTELKQAAKETATREREELLRLSKEAARL